MGIARHIRKLEGYVPGEQPKSKNVVKLNTNENPYPPSPKCTAVLTSFDLDDLRRYPDPNFTTLAKAIADKNGTTADRVFVGNGSDEILSLATRVFVENDESIGSLDPSYTLYKTLAAIRDVKWVGVGRATGDARRASAILAECRKSSISLFLWTNPNAPTGEFAKPKAIAAFARKFKGVVIVDEAYADFSRDNCMSLATAPRNRNVIVMRTFSKSSDVLEELFARRASRRLLRRPEGLDRRALQGEDLLQRRRSGAGRGARGAQGRRVPQKDGCKSHQDPQSVREGPRQARVGRHQERSQLRLREAAGGRCGKRHLLVSQRQKHLGALFPGTAHRRPVLDALDDRFRGEEKTSKTKTRKLPPRK